MLKKKKKFSYAFFSDQNQAVLKLSSAKYWVGRWPYPECGENELGESLGSNRSGFHIHLKHLISFKIKRTRLHFYSSTIRLS